MRSNLSQSSNQLPVQPPSRSSRTRMKPPSRLPIASVRVSFRTASELYGCTWSSLRVHTVRNVQGMCACMRVLTCSLPMLQVERVVLDHVHPQHSSSRVLKVVEPECGVAYILVVRMALYGAHARQMCEAEYTHVEVHSRHMHSTCAHDTPRGIRCLP